MNLKDILGIPNPSLQEVLGIKDKLKEALGMTANSTPAIIQSGKKSMTFPTTSQALSKSTTIAQSEQDRGIYNSQDSSVFKSPLLGSLKTAAGLNYEDNQVKAYKEASNPSQAAMWGNNPSLSSSNMLASINPGGLESKGAKALSKGEILKSNPLNFKTAEAQPLKSLVEEAKKYKSAEEFVKKISNTHRPPDIKTGSRLDNLTNSYGEDIYSKNALQYFGDESYLPDKQAISIINKAKNNPDLNITVYRTVEKGDPSEILPGDWISLSKQYALEHADRSLKGKTILLEKSVPVKDIVGNGDSLVEYGYRPNGHIDFTRQELIDIWKKSQRLK